MPTKNELIKALTEIANSLDKLNTEDKPQYIQSELYRLTDIIDGLIGQLDDES